MKKFFIPVSILLATISSASAYEVAGTVSVSADDAVVYTTSVQSAPGSRGEMGTVTLTASPSALPVKAMAGTATMVRAMPVDAGIQFAAAIVTGDTTVDAKLRTLQEEYVKKMKALNAEYDAKVKATIGDLKPKNTAAYSVTNVSTGQAELRTVTADQQGALTVNGDAGVQIKEGKLITVDANGSTTVSAVTPLTQLKGFFFRFFQ